MMNFICFLSFSERFKEILEDYGLIALAAVPSLVIIGVLIAKYIKLLIADPLGSL